MNILIISQYFWPENFRINDLAIELVNRGHQITVLTGKPNYPGGHYYPGYSFYKPFKEEYHKIKIIRSPLFPRGRKKPYQLVLNYISFCFFSSIVGAIFLRKKFDAIFVFEPSPVTVGIPAILIKYLTKSPIFFWVQDLWPDSLKATGAIKSKLILNTVNQLVRFIYHHCDLILTTSNSFIDRISAQGQSKNKIEYFPQWPDKIFEQVVKPNSNNSIEPLPKGFKIIFAGNIGEAQSFETILSATELTKHIPDIKWVIIGDGRKRKWVENEISKRNLEDSIFLLGSKPLESMPDYYDCADALLITLKKDPIFEMTIPGKIQSCLVSSKPILASLDGEGEQIINSSECGYTSPAEDSAKLAENVIKMFHTPLHLREKMGENGKKYADMNFSRHQLISKLESFFETHSPHKS